MLYSLLQQHGLLRTKMSKHSIKLSAAGRTVLIVLCVYVFSGVIALTNHMFTLRNSGLFVDAQLDYWRCEATGVDPENACNRASFEELMYPGLTILASVLTQIFPAVNLMFAINMSELKQKFKTWCGHTVISTNTATTANETSLSPMSTNTRKTI